MVNTKQNRMSIVVFFHPQPDAFIGAAPELIDEAHPKLYQTVKAKDYDTVFMSQDFRGKRHLNAVLVDQAKQVKV